MWQNENVSVPLSLSPHLLFLPCLLWGSVAQEITPYFLSLSLPLPLFHLPSPRTLPPSSPLPISFVIHPSDPFLANRETFSFFFLTQVLDMSHFALLKDLTDRTSDYEIRFVTALM